MNNKKKIAIFASGSGTNFEALAQACADGRLNADVVLMVCDKPGAKVIERAQRFGVESFVFSPKAYPSKADFEREIVQLLRDRQVDLICLAGYHAVEDAVAYGVKVFGITIHYVDETLDSGKIIAQRAFPYDGNDPDEVHRIGQKIEHELYVDTVCKLLDF